MTQSSDAVSATQEFEAVSSIVSGLQACATNTVNKAQRGIKSLFNFLINDAEIENFVASLQGKAPSEKTSGIARAIKRISNSAYYSPSANSVAPYGYFCSRPIIGDCSPIAGGIYLGADEQEAVVVDEKYETLRAVAQDFRGRIAGVIGRSLLDDLQLLRLTLQYVRDILALDKEQVAKLNRTLGGKEDRKIALDSYLNAGCGAPRHLALLSAFLLEHCKRTGMIKGCASIDTSQADERLVYTSFTGDLYIIDFTKAVIEAGH